MSNAPENAPVSEIQHAYPLILNKVASPQYATPVLRRARLLDWLNDAADCRAVVLAADAGYGKTTLLWQWEREVPFPCYWYKLDRNDRDWTFHISYLIEAIARRHEGFGVRAHSMLEQMGGPGSSRPGVAAYLLAEMHQRLTEPCTFIIDDWQFVTAVTEVRGLWNQILRDAPATCRFVFSSRVKPRLQFARLKTHGGYAELRTDALRFTESEIAELFRDVYNDPLDPTELTELDRRTEGWAASLQLVEVSLRERSTPEERRDFIRSITATNDSALFEFLAEEVLDQQPDETRNFLLTTSILHQITPEVAERLAGVHDGRRELTDLEHRGLFTNRLDEERYRYHGLFREFLERRLVAERVEQEVIGLHIHAASYFETTHQWPEAIHHYLRAGLQRQAARLIAKYGEDIVTNGGLGLVDEWLRELPEEAIRANARLSLLYGEACGMRGEWDRAVQALERARTYFARKGDRRLEALSCLKLSSVFVNLGENDRAAEVAEIGIRLAPPDAAETRLRLRGNLAVTRGWISEPLEAVILECLRIAREGDELGLGHISAISLHNGGTAQRHAGRIEEAVANLQKAADFWSSPTSSPFADNLELVTALLARGEADRARRTAIEAMRRTSAWPRPSAMARLAYASVLAFDGEVDSALSELGQVISLGKQVGSVLGQATAAVVELMYLSGRDKGEIAAIADRIDEGPSDYRLASETVPGRAIGRHTRGDCTGQCIQLLADLDRDYRLGGKASVIGARVKVGTLAFEHRPRKAQLEAWQAVSEATELGLVRSLRPWLRRYANPVSLRIAARLPAHASHVVRLAELDPEGWRDAVADALPTTTGETRRLYLRAIERTADRRLTTRLRSIPGHDVAEVRGRLQDQQAPRLFVRTFGRLAVHRGSWTGPEIAIEKRRARALLAALAAGANEPIHRDTLVDRLWPNADGDAAVNSLNQTVFQLRRYLDPSYRAGASPEYIESTGESVAFNTRLVHVDLADVRQADRALTSGSIESRNRAAARIVGHLQGEFLPEFQFEDWLIGPRQVVSLDIRRSILPVVASRDGVFSADVRVHAGTALLRLDPFDEAAVVALADAMAADGKRVAARDLLVTYAQRIAAELDESPSGDLLNALKALRRGPVESHAI